MKKKQNKTKDYYLISKNWKIIYAKKIQVETRVRIKKICQFPCKHEYGKTIRQKALRTYIVFSIYFTINQTGISFWFMLVYKFKNSWIAFLFFHFVLFRLSDVQDFRVFLSLISDQQNEIEATVTEKIFFTLCFAFREHVLIFFFFFNLKFLLGRFGLPFRYM